MDPTTNKIHNPCVKECSTDNEDREHGDHGRRRKASEGLFRGQVAAENQNHQTRESSEIDGEFLGQKQIHHNRQKEEEKPDLQGHKGVIL